MPQAAGVDSGLANTTILAVIAIAGCLLTVPPDCFQTTQSIPAEAPDAVRQQTTCRIIRIARSAAYRQLIAGRIDAVALAARFHSRHGQSFALCHLACRVPRIAAR